MSFSNFAINSLKKRELNAFVLSSDCYCYMSRVGGGMCWSVIGALPDHTLLLIHFCCRNCLFI